MEPKAWNAWFIKGKAAGWQTTGANNRYPECFVNWIKAYEYAPESQKEAVKLIISSEAIDISHAVLKMECKSFVGYQSQENCNDVRNCVNMIQNQCSTLKEKTGIDVYTDAFRKSLALIINDQTIAAQKAAIDDFGTERRHQDKFNWDKYTDALDRCLVLLDKAYVINDDDGLCFTICKNYITIAEQVRDSCSYKFVPNAYTNGSYVQEYTFTAEAKKSRTNTIDDWKKKKEYYDPTLRKRDYEKVLATADKTIAAAEEDAAYKKYWDEHAEEKNALEAEKTKLYDDIESLRKQKKENPDYDKKKEIEGSISSMTVQQKSLGLFKGKEKKALQEKINSAQADLRTLEDQIKATETSFDGKIKPLDTRAREIEDELKKSRGREPLTHGARPAFFADGKTELEITPVDMLHYLTEKLPKPFNLKTGTEADIINSTMNLWVANRALDKLLGKNVNASDKWVDDPTKNKTYRFAVQEGSKDIKTSVFVDAKSTTSPIDSSFRIRLDNKYTTVDAADFVKVATALIYDFLPEKDMTEIHKFLVSGVYGMQEPKVIEADGIKIEIRRSINVTLTVSRS